jgi:hypothetical protein
MPTAALPADHDARMERARLALDGLSVGDGFGSAIFIPGQSDSLHRPRLKTLPTPAWCSSRSTACRGQKPTTPAPSPRR